MIPPEIVILFKDWPAGLLAVFLAAPFLVLLGGIATLVVQRARDKGVQKVAEANLTVSSRVVEVSEKEANTHHVQMILDGLTTSITVLTGRADAAEKKADAAEKTAEAADKKADAAEQQAKDLGKRVRQLEDERHDAIDHIIYLESLIPDPPGPPARPNWMRRHLLHRANSPPDKTE